MQNNKEYPKFEVVGLYPNCIFKVGDILERVPRATEDWYHDSSNTEYYVSSRLIMLSELEAYPHLFRVLGEDAAELPDLQLGDKVYHKEIYNGREECLIIGLKPQTVQVLYDPSGGTHSVKGETWVSRDGILTQKNK
jgi:hypothetical protein